MRSSNFLLLLCLIISTACNKAPPQLSQANRGNVVRFVSWRSWTVSEIVDGALSRISSETEKAALKVIFNILVTHDVEAYDIEYETIDTKGEPTIASGTVMFPKGVASPLPILSYQHGTVLPRYFHKDEDQFVKLLPIVAGSGFMAIGPHYLGHEASEGFHPYVHKDSLASSSLDMLRAARTFAQTQNRAIDPSNLFLLGYSEGGYATAALQREMETSDNAGFRIRASAPSAGPYDLTGTMIPSILSRSLYPRAVYIPYIVVGFNNVYNIYPNGIEDFVKPEFVSLVHQIYDGERDAISESDADDKLPNPPIDLFSAKTLADIQDPGSLLFSRIAANDIPGWMPKVPTTLFHCEKDDFVPYKNSEILYQKLIDHGADPSVVKLNKVIGPGLDGHLSCATPILLEAFLWFRAILALEKLTPEQEKKLKEGVEIDL